MLPFSTVKDSTVAKGYSVAKCYGLIIGNTRALIGYKQVWCSLALPKHRFIFWLMAQHKLLTKDILLKRIPGIDETCSVCGICLEDHDHLFFCCHFSHLLSRLVYNWLNSAGWHFQFNEWSLWFHELKLSNFRDFVSLAILQALVYIIWSNGNLCIFSTSCLSVQFCFKEIKDIVSSRLGLYRNRAKSPADREFWARLFG